MIRLLVFSHLLNLFHFKMPICHFQSMGMGWMWGGGYGSGPVFPISVMSYHYMFCFVIIVLPSLSVCTASSNAGPKPGCAVVHATHEMSACIAILAFLQGMAIALTTNVIPSLTDTYDNLWPFFMAWEPHCKCDSQS